MEFSSYKVVDTLWNEHCFFESLNHEPVEWLADFSHKNESIHTKAHLNRHRLFLLSLYITSPGPSEPACQGPLNK